MKRQRYIIRNATGEAVAEVQTRDGEEPELEPWMIENINHAGWSVQRFDSVQSDVNLHGYVNWQQVATALAEALRPVLDDTRAISDEEEAEGILDAAQQALDAYDVAVMEASLTITATEPEQQEGSGG